MFVKSPTTLDSAPEPSEPGPPPYEAVLEQSLSRLQQRTAVYQEAEQKGHESTETEAQNLVAAMRGVGDSHPDPKVRGEWYQRAKRFSRAGRTARRGILSEVGGIVHLVLLVPRVALGTALHIVGETTRTAGMMVRGLGDFVVGSSREGEDLIKASEGDKRRGYS
ncbi:hypothetical protein C0995_009045 [Termitomyces sp. Mi166|nr:hypothetical protein C0995_009045 [Termitomyces sp. Mi166\